ncbi:FAD-dependent oxidoreductase [Oerskovia sp. Sa1BUA8]|uniref:3-oxosteroid 1-dehydrogenase n=1 Tax=Oerskovia douganii TaxID=2762210 RepID=A0A9D5UDH7_9CELL|nr:FAD-dependent oxidoreductase [Oerskovia douganii]MBE7702001.1 FAD-dependent oxidoreductase [Oerskovia douganii]
MERSWDDEVDVLVVGTGAAGLSAAIAAADAGSKVLLVEGTDRWGGTTMRSGGGLWMPANPLMARDGVDDSVEKALTYLDAVVEDAGPATSPERKRAFVEAVPEVVTSLEKHGVRWVRATDYPDYYPEQPGGMVGRSIEARAFDTRRLGSWIKYSRMTDGGMPLPLRTDDVWLLARAWSSASGFVRGARFVGRTLGSLVRGQRPAGIGAALVCSLMQVVRDQGTPVLLSTPLVELVVEDDAVVGAVLGGPAVPRTVRTRGGVVVAAGGFAHRTEWREKYHGVPGWSAAADGDLGTGIEAGVAAGGTLALMDDAWWGAGVPVEGGMNGFVLSERSMPYSILVDQEGRRYTNESASYIDFGHAMLEHDSTTPSIPSWLVLDARARRKYLFTIAPSGTKKLEKAGTLVVADTLEDLARLLHIAPENLAATVERFNGFARSGVDEDFHRGDSLYDRYYGDPGVRPNPNLGPIEKGPFTAVKIVPGDLGTKGGLLTDEHGAVLREDLTPVPGLYAAGNSTAAVTGRTYPGPGSTIGPAVVFGYLGARHAARRAVLASTP